MSIEELRRKAIQLGATDLRRSTRSGKKWMVIYQGKKIHFGDKKYHDFTMHRDEKRRANYHKRHKSIKLKDGTPAYLNKNQSSFWSLALLWN